MNTPSDNTPALTRDEAIKQSIGAQVAELLESNYAKIVRAAQESFRQEEEAGEIEAKINFSVSFFPAIQSPKVTVKVSWGVKYSDESEVVVDCEQSKLPFEVAKEAVKEIAAIAAKHGATVTLSTPETSADFLKRANRFAKKGAA